VHITARHLGRFQIHNNGMGDERKMRPVYRTSKACTINGSARKLQTIPIPSHYQLSQLEINK